MHRSENFCVFSLDPYAVPRLVDTVRLPGSMELLLCLFTLLQCILSKKFLNSTAKLLTQEEQIRLLREHNHNVMTKATDKDSGPPVLCWSLQTLIKSEGSSGTTLIAVTSSCYSQTTAPPELVPSVQTQIYISINIEECLMLCCILDL